jgi:hypothetical protein
MRSAVRPLSILVLTLALLGACEAGKTTETGVSTAERARFLAAMDGLCQTQAFAQQEQYSLARQTFADQSHQYLHDVAARLQDQDPEVAGMLLEAKQQVETGLKDPPFYGTEEVVRRIVALQEALGQAGGVLGLPEAGCGA